MAHDPGILLREHGLRVTSQRLAVLRAVARRPHCTAETVAEHVRADIGTISRQAVYDALGALTDKGLLRRIEPAGSPALYDPRVDDHHHLVCRTCSRTVDVDCVGEAHCQPAVGTEFRVDRTEVTFWGTCAACREQPPGA